MKIHPFNKLIFGSTFDEGCAGKVRVSVLATGIDSAHFPGPSGSREGHSSKSSPDVSSVADNTSPLSTPREGNSDGNSSFDQSDPFLRGSNNHNINWGNKAFDVPAFLRKK